MRDTKQLHPALQKKITELITLCKKNGIAIGIGECLRTVIEQDALYAKGRTIGGSIVTNARGSSYSSMHQWGVAFDFFLKTDVDGDGKTSDDAFNNSTHLFEKVGKLGKSIGLEWGGDWKSIKDLPHFQLADWGSTATKLKSEYGTPEKFFATWGITPTEAKTETNTFKLPSSKSKPESAKGRNAKYARTYTTTANLNLRLGAGTNKGIVTVIPKGGKVQCYGFYTKTNGTPWYFVQYGKYTGYVNSKYVK